MSLRNKRQMAPPLDQDGPAPTPAPAYQTGYAPAPALHSSAHIHALLCGSGAVVPTPGGQSAWWPGPLPQVTPSAATSINYGMDYYPPGGFMSFLQTGQQSFISQVSAPYPPMGKESQLAPPKNDSGNQNTKKRSKGKTIINLEDGNDGRTAKHLVFEPDEDERLNR